MVEKRSACLTIPAGNRSLIDLDPEVTIHAQDPSVECTVVQGAERQSVLDDRVA